MYNMLAAGEKILATLRLELFRTLLMQVGPCPAPRAHAQRAAPHVSPDVTTPHALRCEPALDAARCCCCPQRISFFDSHPTAELTALISAELDAVRNFLFK
jgi:ATP-binding cassette subfamily B (MDR/TAP) protein 10